MNIEIPLSSPSYINESLIGLEGSGRRLLLQTPEIKKSVFFFGIDFV